MKEQGRGREMRSRSLKTTKDGEKTKHLKDSRRGGEENLLKMKKRLKGRRNALGFKCRPTHSRRMLFMSKVKNFFLPS